jgi:hypothetical protein
MHPETFWSLMHDLAHWEFELFVGFVEMLVFDGLVGLLLWPQIRKHWQHHVARDRADGYSTKRKK